MARERIDGGQALAYGILLLAILLVVLLSSTDLTASAARILPVP